jgi:hypothetical protein
LAWLGLAWLGLAWPDSLYLKMETETLPKYWKITIFVRGLPLKADPVHRTPPAKT